MMAIRPPQFGQKEYWDEQYKQEKSFSWYTGWPDLRPFWEEVIAPPTTRALHQRHSVTPASHQRHTSVTPRVPPVQVCPNRTARVLVPGVGNDAAMVSMYDDGWKRLTLFDYSPEGVRRAAELFGERPVDLRVADACALPYASAAFDAVLDKVRLKAFVSSSASASAAAAAAAATATAATAVAAAAIAAASLTTIAALSKALWWPYPYPSP